MFDEVNAVTDITLNRKSATITLGNKLQLTATILPLNATYKEVVWSSSNTSVATVNDGLITAINPGNAIITAKTVDGGKTSACTIKVESPPIVNVIGITLDKHTAILAKGLTMQLNAVITPSDVTNKSLKWSSSDLSVASVDSTGLVTANTAGRVTITATAKDNGKKDSCIMTSFLPLSNENCNINQISFKIIGVWGGVLKTNRNIDVTINSFSIGRYEVTQELWYAVMGNYPAIQSHGSGNNYPVHFVSWNNIVGTGDGEGYTINGVCYYKNGFCYKLSQLIGNGKRFRLPTEAEWEYAAKGGQRTHNYLFSGSSQPIDVAWFKENSEGTTHPVGTKAPNELGIYDMSGNVWEWCSDFYFTTCNEYGYCTSLFPSGTDNPIGFASGVKRVIRGGSYDSYESVIWRSCAAPSLNFYDQESFTIHDPMGFRLACSP
ncbi:MAG: SUMF1/EgtB/PvdO family nonheme iron enzyme [Paludibacter sp.]|nr:SUMF1/EgtB/PvdO family nonheme iron enzyme [Paludibacter sp.]